jgi:hypothetical protein
VLCDTIHNDFDVPSPQAVFKISQFFKKLSFFCFPRKNEMLAQSGIKLACSSTLRKRLRAVSRLGRRAPSRPDNPLRFLPKNNSLESSIALSVYYRQDPRSMLTFTKELMGSTLISLATPVGAWDPYDVKPQVFALDTYLGIPVFSSVSYLQDFCRKFHFCVRDPTGRLWSDGEGSEPTPLIRPPVEAAEQPTAPSVDATQLFDILEETRMPHEGVKKSGKRRRRKPNSSTVQTPQLPVDLWTRIDAEPRLGISKATPLPMFGPLLRPYFVGYFADVETLLRNASIAPEKADIVLNPSSPLEIVLGRGATDRVLHRDTLILTAYQQFEKQIRSEFHSFFTTHCPEISSAFSACIAKAHSSDLFHNYIDYTIVVIVRSDDMLATFRSLVEAKSTGALLDHPNLEVLPDTDAAAHAKAAASPFYKRSAFCADAAPSKPRRVSVMRCVSPAAQVSLGIDSDNYFSDPTNLYTESGFVFSGEASTRRR